MGTRDPEKAKRYQSEYWRKRYAAISDEEKEVWRDRTRQWKADNPKRWLKLQARRKAKREARAASSASEEMLMAHEEYLRRNLIVAKAVGAQASISKSLKRLEQMSRAPRWLLVSLQGVLERQSGILIELAAWRNAAEDAPADVCNTVPKSNASVAELLSERAQANREASRG